AERLLKPSNQGEAVRYRVVDGRRAHSVRGLFKEYPEGEWSEDALFEAQTRMDAALAELVSLLHGLRDGIGLCASESGMNACADLAAQLDGIAESIVAFANEANFVLKGETDTHAYWIERVRPEKRRAHVRLVAAPLSVADALAARLYDAKDSVVLCSATLRVGNDFKYMSRRLGCSDRFRTLNAVSPFNYLAQSLVLAPDCLPDPSADSGGYASALASMMEELFSETGGRALALFTSYEMMKTVAADARAALERDGIELIVQGDGRSRESMTRALKGAGAADPPRTVLFGAQSFWEGVDVAGEALSCVVIARLPFAMVGDPIVEARSEKIDREGGSSFRDYALPEAVIKFRQGFGRLIRTKRDRGVVVVTDPRIVTKPYGAIFRRSIPASVHTVADAPELLRRVEEFFES
ncbi:MAG: hypothetical protein IJI73_07470, partial [Kiritimatiellae bacterium]|nr:hypothetical protein [Kiritimatiellia bacterium]